MKNDYLIEGSRSGAAPAAAARAGRAAAAGDAGDELNGGRKLRSRSSPVRSLVRRVTPRARSPSVSPCAPSPPSPLLQLPRQAGAVPESGGGAWRAYYSARPPSAPLRLHALPLPPTASRPASAAPIAADVATATPTFPLPQNKKASQSHRRIRSILRELVAYLPLERCSELFPAPVKLVEPAESIERAEPAASFPSSPNFLSEASPAKPRDPKIASSVSSESFRSPPCGGSAVRVQAAGTRRHVAVQALGATGSAPAGGAGGADWAGGVRALRDAHVRLVLRQLRHLRRLNAAVDRATVAAAANAAPQR